MTTTDRVILHLLPTLVFLALMCCRARGDEPTIEREAAQVQFGHELFTDPKVLSFERTMACSTCHSLDPKLGFSDGLTALVGMRGTRQFALGTPGIRNTISLVGCKYVENGPCNSDGRVNGLKSMILQACTDPTVMGMPSISLVVDRVNSEPRYKYLASTANKPGENWTRHQVTEDEIRTAMVAFVKTIDSPDLPADRLYAGLPTSLPQTALEGWEIFQANCIVCHDPAHGWSDNQFHNIGIASRSQSNDLGRGAVTGNPADNYKFKTARLSECARTAPYMHDGSLKSLREVVGFFAKGGRYMLNGEKKIDPTIDQLVAQIDLTDKKIDRLVDFMELGFQGENFPHLSNPHETKVASGGNQQ